MAQKKRTIYYYSPTLRDKDDEPLSLANDFWEVIWEDVANLENSGFNFNHYGKSYIVRAEELESPPVKFLYVGKVRPRFDWPDHQGLDQDRIDPLSDSGLEGYLVEGAYITPANYKNVVAVARTHNGPTMSAIAAAISHQLETFRDGREFELTAFTRADQFKRLQEAKGATRIRLTLDNETDLDQIGGDGELSEVFSKVKAMDRDGQMTVGLMVSFGNFVPPQDLQKKLQQSLVNLVGEETDAQKFTKAEATLTREDENGKLKKETVDFISDRVTVKGSFDNDENEQPKREDILRGILEANEKFRKKLRES